MAAVGLIAAVSGAWAQGPCTGEQLQMASV